MIDLTLGEVREFQDKSRLRIMGFDDYTVFYDLWRHDTNRWTFANRRTFSYYRFHRSWLDSSWQVGAEPFTEADLALHRPDLPLRTAQSRTFNWDRRSFPSLEAFVERAETVGLDVAELERSPPIESAQVALIGFGARGGAKHVQVVKADNGHSFSPVELLWKANEYQTSLTLDLHDGVGLYRAGVDKRIPLYYLGEKYDAFQMDMLRKYDLLPLTR